jgi:hypothetical protein
MIKPRTMMGRLSSLKECLRLDPGEDTDRCFKRAAMWCLSAVWIDLDEEGIWYCRLQSWDRMIKGGRNKKEAFQKERGYLLV